MDYEDIMLDLKNLTKEQLNSIQRRGKLVDIDYLLLKYDQQKKCTTVLNEAREQLNLMSKSKPTPETIEKAKEISNNIKDLELNLKKVTDELNSVLIELPNILDNSVPNGVDENDNVEIKKIGIPIHNTDHYTLDNIFTKTEMTGSRFYILSNEVAALERALISFMMNKLIHKGFIEYSLPYILLEEAFIKSRHIPRDRENMFKVEENQYLIPTGEVALVNILSGNKFQENDMPKKLCTVTDCFRKEAGAAGKDTKGIIRVHQFKKCEMVVATTPEKSMLMLEEMLNISCEMLEELEIPYRVIVLCSGDTGATSIKTYDIEIPIGGRWREVASISNCGSYQSVSAGIRVQLNNGQTVFAHLLNGSALAVGRTLASLIEVHEQNGKIIIPKCLHKYMNFESFKI